MEDQELEVYDNFIQQLLTSPPGQTRTTLQSCPEMVNADLLVVIDLYALYLANQGDNNSQRLQELSSQLRQELEIEINDSTKTEAAYQFLIDTLTLLVDKRGEEQQIYSTWAHQNFQLNLYLLANLPTFVTRLFKRNPEHRKYIATALLGFGFLIQRFPKGIHWFNLELAITAYQQCFQVFTENDFPEDWAYTVNNLANAYSARIKGNRAENLEKAIELYQSALRVRTRVAFPKDWASTQNSLGVTYRERIRGQRSDNFEKALLACQLALQVYTREAFPEDWAMAQQNLALIYSDRIVGKRADNLERAIKTYQLALQVYTFDFFPIKWAMIQNNLGTAYFERILGERINNLEKAIEAYKLALKVRTYNALPEQWAATQNNLASAYYRRIQGERADNLERAIEAYQFALRVYTRNALPEKWAMTQSNLGLTYSIRLRGNKADNLEKAIKSCKLALEIYTNNDFPEDWAMTQSHLASAYSSRVQGERADNLEKAIEAYQLALEVRTRDTFPEKWAMTQNNLGIVYRKRIRGNRADNLERAIEAYQLALEVRTHDTFPEKWAMTQNNLGVAYSKRIYGSQADNRKKAIEAYQSALQIYLYDAFPMECRDTAQNLGNLYFQQENWAMAATSYVIALSASERLYQSCVFLEGKAAELAESAEIPPWAAYAMARTDQARKAVEVMEQGRARGLSESLSRDRANLNDLQQQNVELYQQYRDLIVQLRNLEDQQRGLMTSSDDQNFLSATIRETLMSLRQQINILIQEIRQIPGYDSFVALPSFEDVHRAVTDDQPFIYLLTTSAGSLALIVTPDNIESVRLDMLAEPQLVELLNQTWLAAYKNSQNDHQGWLNAIDLVAQRLGKLLMEPILHNLKVKGFIQAIFVPTGYLSLLPLHAAWVKDTTYPTNRRYALDDIHITYSPNAQSLNAARVLCDSNAVNSILAIDDPLRDLSYAAYEVQTAVETFPQSQVLKHEQATVEAVKADLINAQIVHCACHGVADLNFPLKSGLVMSNGLLTLKDILALNLTENGGLRLAILSACETGLQGTNNIDEAISLPTGLLQAGVAAVVSTLWSVSDLSTTVLLIRFYELWRQDGLQPAVAIRQAQTWVRDTTNGEKVAHYKSLLSEKSSSQIPPKIADFLYKQLILSHSKARDFAHPFHWAAFSYTGV